MGPETKVSNGTICVPGAAQGCFSFYELISPHLYRLLQLFEIKTMTSSNPKAVRTKSRLSVGGLEGPAQNLAPFLHRVRCAYLSTLYV